MPALALATRPLAALLLVGMACSSDPATDRRIPREPKVERWVAAAHIAAPPELVWQVLVDFDAYAQWNPWLVEAHGDARVGAAVDARVELKGKTRRAAHKVFEVDAPHRFCWRDAGATTAFATGSRCRVLEDDGAGGTDYRVELWVGGSFRRSVRKNYGPSLDDGMRAETEALLRRAEALAGGS